MCLPNKASVENAPERGVKAECSPPKLLALFEGDRGVNADLIPPPSGGFELPFRPPGG